MSSLCCHRWQRFAIVLKILKTARGFLMCSLFSTFIVKYCQVIETPNYLNASTLKKTKKSILTVCNTFVLQVNFSLFVKPSSSH